MRNYSVIKLYDFEKKQLRKITKKSRYFAPALSGDGKRIVTVHVSQNAKYSLHILDAQSGNILKEIKAGNNLFFMTPHWSADDKYIVSAVLGKEGKSIIKINSLNWSTEYILPFSYKEIKWPVMYGDWVVYAGTYEGKDNLYAVQHKTKEIYKVFEARFGANYATFSNGGDRSIAGMHS